MTEHSQGKTLIAHIREELRQGTITLREALDAAQLQPEALEAFEFSPQQQVRGAVVDWWQDHLTQRERPA